MQRIIPPGLLGLLLVPLLPWSCQRRSPTPLAPPPPNYLELGDRYFEAADYLNAVVAYTAYLRDNPTAPQRDRALFRLALAHAFPESPLQNPQQAIAFLRELLSLHPQSLFRPQAELLLQWQEEIERLRSDVSYREQRIAELTQELGQLKQVELERLRSAVNRREERIRQLSEELEKLKQIDLQRRPTPPPP